MTFKCLPICSFKKDFDVENDAQLSNVTIFLISTCYWLITKTVCNFIDLHHAMPILYINIYERCAYNLKYLKVFLSRKALMLNIMLNFKISQLSEFLS